MKLTITMSQDEYSELIQDQNNPLSQLLGKPAFQVERHVLEDGDVALSFPQRMMRISHERTFRGLCKQRGNEAFSPVFTTRDSPLLAFFRAMEKGAQDPEHYEMQGTVQEREEATFRLCSSWSPLSQASQASVTAYYDAHPNRALRPSLSLSEITVIE